MTRDQIAQDYASEFTTLPQIVTPLPRDREEISVSIASSAGCSSGPNGQLSGAGDNTHSINWAVRYPANDAGNAHLLVDRYGDRLRYIAPWKRWLVFDQGWKHDWTGAVKRYAVQLSQELIAESARITNESDRRSAVKRALTMGDSTKIDAMLSLACVDPRVTLRPESLDTDPWMAGLPNGLLDLRSGERVEHSPQVYVTKSLGAVFNAEARAPRWEQFLNEIFQGNEELIRFVQKAAGYSLTGQTTEQCFFFLWGTGRNGKSKFIETLQRVLGDYGSGMAPEVITMSRYETAPHQLAALHGARFVTLPETEENQRLAESRLKALVGGDKMTACRKYEHSFDFNPLLKLWIHGNYKPVIKGTDEGIWRRVRLIPFTQQFEGCRADPNLGQVLDGELPGILNWLIEGCRLWQQQGLIAPDLVRNAVAQYRSDEDILGQFIREVTVESPDGYIGTIAMYQAYQEWTDRQGYRYPLTQNKLGRRLRDRGYREGQRNGTPSWLGLRFNI